MEQNINALYPRPKGRGSTAIFDRKEAKNGFFCFGTQSNSDFLIALWFAFKYGFVIYGACQTLIYSFK